MSTLKEQIEEAFHYRGHVTIDLQDGTQIEGFVYNREFENAKLPQDQFVDLYLKGSADSKRLKVTEIRAISLTGEDHAAGKSYEEWLAKHKDKKKAS